MLPTTSQPVPNAAQRASATDPAVIKLLSFIPVGDASGRASFARPDLQNFQELTARVDHAFSKKTLMAVRYFYDRFTRNAVFDPNNILTYSDGSTIRSQNLLISRDLYLSAYFDKRSPLQLRTRDRPTWPRRQRD